MVPFCCDFRCNSDPEWYFALPLIMCVLRSVQCRVCVSWRVCLCVFVYLCWVRLVVGLFDCLLVCLCFLCLCTYGCLCVRLCVYMCVC